MPRNMSGVFSYSPGHEAVTGETIEASQHNIPLDDLRTDANAARPIVAGGTGATTADAALDNLGGGTTGKALFAAANAAAARTTLEASASGATVFTGTPAQARTALELGTAALVSTGTNSGQALLSASGSVIKQGFVAEDTLTSSTSTSYALLSQNISFTPVRSDTAVNIAFNASVTLARSTSGERNVNFALYAYDRVTEAYIAIGNPFQVRLDHSGTAPMVLPITLLGTVPGSQHQGQSVIARLYAQIVTGTSVSSARVAVTFTEVMP